MMILFFSFLFPRPRHTTPASYLCESFILVYCTHVRQKTNVFFWPPLVSLCIYWFIIVYIISRIYSFVNALKVEKLFCGTRSCREILFSLRGYLISFFFVGLILHSENFLKEKLSVRFSRYIRKHSSCVWCYKLDGWMDGGTMLEKRWIFAFRHFRQKKISGFFFLKKRSCAYLIGLFFTLADLCDKR